jgi:hypothetical protein
MQSNAGRKYQLPKNQLKKHQPKTNMTEQAFGWCLWQLDFLVSSPFRSWPFILE